MMLLTRSKTAEVLVGNPIPALVKGADITRDIAGMYTIDETGNKTEFDINGFVMPNNDVTVFPYFGCEEGYTSLSIGSGANNMYNTDGLNGSKTGDQVSSFYVDNTITINEAVCPLEDTFYSLEENDWIKMKVLKFQHTPLKVGNEYQTPKIVNVEQIPQFFGLYFKQNI